jgi:sulfoxide reductase heme-binding subunit YedZ
VSQTGKRALRHFALAVGSAAATSLIFAGIASDDPRFRLSMATAYVGTALLVATLAIGPLNVLRSRPNPVSTNLRRDVAIWAGIVSLAHLVAGLRVHMIGNMEQYFLFPPEWTMPIPIRFDPFGLANWTGLIAGVILLLLLALSNDLSLRRLGSTRWKAVQRWSYWAGGLVIAHGVLYQLVLEDRAWPWILVFAALVAAAAGAQVAGFRSVRGGRARGAGVGEEG